MAGSQRETERGAIARGQAHRGRSKSGARPGGGQNKHVSGGGDWLLRLFALTFLILGTGGFFFTLPTKLQEPRSVPCLSGPPCFYFGRGAAKHINSPGAACFASAAFQGRREAQSSSSRKKINK